MKASAAGSSKGASNGKWAKERQVAEAKLERNRNKQAALLLVPESIAFVTSPCLMTNTIMMNTMMMMVTDDVVMPLRRS